MSETRPNRRYALFALAIVAVFAVGLSGCLDASGVDVDEMYSVESATPNSSTAPTGDQGAASAEPTATDGWGTAAETLAPADDPPAASDDRPTTSEPPGERSAAGRNVVSDDDGGSDDGPSNDGTALIVVSEPGSAPRVEVTRGESDGVQTVTTEASTPTPTPTPTSTPTTTGSPETDGTTPSQDDEDQVADQPTTTTATAATTEEDRGPNCDSDGNYEAVTVTNGVFELTTGQGGTLLGTVVVGEVENTARETMQEVSVTVTLYDEGPDDDPYGGDVIGTQTVTIGNVEPDERGSWAVYFRGVAKDDVYRKTDSAAADPPIPC